MEQDFKPETNPLNQQTQTAPQQEPQKSGSKTLLVIALIIMIALAALVIASYCFPAQDRTQPTIEQNNNETASITPSKIEGWQTYTDDAMGITLKFPKEWLVSTTGSGTFILSTVDLFHNNSDSSEKENVPSFTVMLRASYNELSLDKWYEEYALTGNPSDVIEKKSLTIAGNPAIETTDQNDFKNYFMAKGSHVVSVDFDSKPSEYLSTYETILANLEIFEVKIPNGNYKASKNNIFAKPIAATQIDDNAYRFEYNEIISALGASTNGEGVLVSPEEKKYPLAKNIEEQLQEITGVVSNPDNKDMVFISTSDAWSMGTDSADSCINKLYTYNLKTGELIEFYTETSKGDSPFGSKSCRILRVRGIQGSQLILQMDDPGNSPGPCTGIWSDYSDKFLYMELADIQAGLKNFTVPEYKIQADKKEISDCQKEFNVDSAPE